MKSVIEYLFKTIVFIKILFLLNFFFEWVEIPNDLWGLTLIASAVIFLLYAYYYKQPVQNK
jgi:hypothetical protein